MIRGGRSYVSSPPAFSNDGKRLLVCAGNSVSVFSTSTGLQVSSLEGHQAAVTTVIVVPETSLSSKVLCFCWTAALDGTIRYWDFSVPELIKTVDIQLPVFSMVIPSLLSPLVEKEKSQNIYAYLSVENSKGQDNESKVLRGQILKCNLTESRLVGGVILKETGQPEFLISSPTGNFFGIRDKRKIHLWRVPTSDSKRSVTKKITLHHTKKLTVLAFHPSERIVAAGDVTGRILMWRGFGKRTFAVGDELQYSRTMDDEDRAGVRGDDDADSCSTWHWHPTEVNLLSFSSDGAYLYSGGREGVLVVWQFDTGKQKYLPRIGSPLLYFVASPDPSLSSISCADNQIHLLKMPSMEILKSISGIKLPCPIPEAYEGSSNAIAFDCTSGLVALRTENYCVQFYSLVNDHGASEVQVCERNHHPADEITVVVTHVSLSRNGHLMSTSEVKLPEDGVGGLVCLKFWESGSQNREFSLSTIVYEPHRDSGITAIAFHPTCDMAVSSSHGGDFKIWVCKDIQEDVHKKSGWVCYAVGSYKKKRMTAVAFSADGSVLAVAAETVVTLWDPEKNVLLAVIGETRTPILHLSFVGASEYLVSASQGSEPQLSVWNLSKLSVSWSYKLYIEAIASSVDSSSFAVLALPKSAKCAEYSDSTFHGRDGLVLLFNANDPVPVAIWSVRKPKGGAIAFLQVEPSSLEEMNVDGKPPRALLAYVNNSHEYVIFDPYSQEACELSVVHHGGFGATEDSGLYGYASIYGQLPALDHKRNEPPWAPSVPSQKPWETIFGESSHNIPPLTKLSSVFLESLLERRTAVGE